MCFSRIFFIERSSVSELALRLVQGLVNKPHTIWQFWSEFS
jgi:hypothetical protein